MKTALITGASGQDAYYLALLLLKKGYKVVATERRSARERPLSVVKLLLLPNYSTLELDVTDISSIMRAIQNCQPDEFYHLAAQSEVGTSFSQPLTTIDITGMGAANCLEALRILKPDTKFYFAGSSEQYGDTHGTILNEESPFVPRSPYACAKLMGFHLARTYRFSYDMFTCCGILFNHESPERKHYFVTRKITDGVAQIVAGKSNKIRLGNILSGRDWGHAADYVEAAWLMLQAEKPDDYVVATGAFYTIKDLLDIAFAAAGLSEKSGDWKKYVEHGTPENVRPHDVIRLVGDSSKIRDTLGWKPRYTFIQLIEEMVAHDLALHRVSISS